ncbi:MAG: hypothetical protein J3K34DRAFT_416624 [Monoraphidium minutum]|nr:MAG: hypothetical protein J3K34DRAFT_416624 [Monoraphidium minutum]
MGRHLCVHARTCVCAVTHMLLGGVVWGVLSEGCILSATGRLLGAPAGRAVVCSAAAPQRAGWCMYGSQPAALKGTAALVFVFAPPLFRSGFPAGAECGGLIKQARPGGRSAQVVWSSKQATCGAARAAQAGAHTQNKEAR